MNPDRDPQTLADAQRFDLLEHPERWPEDAGSQARLAELLELHLALQAHGPELAAAASPRRFRSSPWLLAAAAVLLAVVPSLYALNHIQSLQAQAKSRAHIQESARRRAELRLWASFFEQSRELIARFELEPPVCGTDREDRSEERALAMALLQASRQLDAQGAPVPGAQLTRHDLQAWLTELSLEDGCLTVERAEELRRLAQAQDLQAQARKLSDLLKGEGS